MVFCIAGWSGFFVMGVELLSGRILAPTFGSGIYVWGGIITVFMLALSLGYLAGGRLSLWQPSLRTLALLLVAAALTTAPVALLADRALDYLFEIFEDPRYGSLVPATCPLDWYSLTSSRTAYGDTMPQIAVGMKNSSVADTSEP